MDEDRRREFDAFQDWCLRTYGEGTKSKTIWLNKYKKIVSSLRGEIPRSAESSKFRFWVKTKGFRLVDGQLYVPASSGGPLRRVAVVEDFYDIIYGIHVGQGAKYGNHAGQKRTYRAVSERFAFLPREAVTRFLLGCSDCQKRLDVDTMTPKRMRTEEYMPINLTTRSCVIQLSVPCSEMRSSTPNRESSEEELDISPVSVDEEVIIKVPDPREMRISPEIDNEEYSGGKNGDVKEERDDWCYTLNKKPGTPQSSSPIHETGSVHDETSSSGNKDDDDEEDDSDDLKSTPHDPERLKAFNMFVRLFVDENLDRIVPISKQPKEKIQAIIDSCKRQFPEFGERARKRIRTYLKSCRRNKRSRDSSFEAARPTPAHLTSAQAEQILASACENEAHNAKRMRLGLEPVAQPMPVLPGTEQRNPIIPEHFSPANLCAETKTFPHVNNLMSKEQVTRTPEQRAVNPTGISSLYRNVPEGPGRPIEPTDLSLRPRLSIHEINSVRRLVAGYRESAAFLLRSADELEQLLLHQ